jgi:hypothetical protein
MKIKFLFLLFITLTLFALNAIQAVGFSPSSLTFDLGKNQEGCKMITIDSDSEKITVSDSWAENESVEWKVSSFNTSSSQHGISVNYDNELSIDERGVEVCLSGSKLGEYHGVWLFKEEQQGSSIVQFGVWLKVLINEQPVAASSSSGGGGGGIVAPKNTTNTTNNSIKFENTANAQSETEAGAESAGTEGETEDSFSRITGRAIWGNINARNLIAPAAVIILAIVALIIYKRKNNLRQRGY